MRPLLSRDIPEVLKKPFIVLTLIACLFFLVSCGSNKVVIGRAEPRETVEQVDKKSEEKAPEAKKETPPAKVTPPETPKAPEPEKSTTRSGMGGMMGGGMMGGALKSKPKAGEPKPEEPKPAESAPQAKVADAPPAAPSDSTTETKPADAAAQAKPAESAPETKVADAAPATPADSSAGAKPADAMAQSKPAEPAPETKVADAAPPKPADSAPDSTPSAPAAASPQNPSIPAPAPLQNMSVQGQTEPQSSPARPRPAPPAEEKAPPPAPYKLDLSFGGFGLGIGLFDNPVSVAVDELENIYVIDQGNFRIEKFDRFGLFQFAFGRQGMGDGEFVDGKLPSPPFPNNAGSGLRMTGEFEFNKPIGMLLDKDDTRNLVRIHVVDSLNNRIERFLLLLNPPPADKFPGGPPPPSGSGVFAALAPSLSPLPVADTGLDEKFRVENRPAILDPLYIAKANPTIFSPFIWGGLGFTQGQLNNPTYLTKDDNGILWVSDTENGRIEGFNVVPADPTRDATFYREFGNDINLPYGQGRLNQPTAIAFDNSGFGGFLVLDKLQGGGFNIQKFDREGRFTGVFATSGDKEGQFKQPVCMALNPSDNTAFITDRARRKVMVYNNKGEFMYEFGGEELADPRGITVLRNNYVYVTDSAKNMVYRYVPQ